MKNVKRVYNATRDRWVKIICKDEPVVRLTHEQLREAFHRAMGATLGKKDNDQGNSR